MRTLSTAGLIFSLIACTSVLAAQDETKTNNGNDKSESAASGNSAGNNGNSYSDSSSGNNGNGNGNGNKDRYVDGGAVGSATKGAGRGTGTGTGAGRGTGTGTGAGRGTGTGGKPPHHVEVRALDQDEAIEAVKKRQALPLEDIVAIAERPGGLDVIDAKLMHVQGILVYRLTLLADSGLTRRVFYYARSGNPIRFN